ncbi:MAG: chromate transporter [Burkholderiales bacterium]|nr:chromate transporter [Burkholderiales bacterium]MDE1928368.1 chromate transporter [Burkholderiales bacterium]MDE2157967.1 chromate transporter [Burkholderiales bacterium]MDE2504868.1 chromate transporter [Burkholderiales bacterium]
MSALLIGPGILHGGADWLALFGHFLVLSLLAIGGAMSTAPDMYRYVVRDQGWLAPDQFNASIALAQAAPGPNLLFVAVIGLKLGGLAGVLTTLTGTLLPSTALALTATRWGGRDANRRWLAAFTTGMAPLTIGLLLATGWILLAPTRTHAAVYVLVALTLWVMLRTQWSPLWLIGLGAVAGLLGWV